jgi:hypothetical protein
MLGGSGLRVCPTSSTDFFGFRPPTLEMSMLPSSGCPMFLSGEAVAISESAMSCQAGFWKHRATCRTRDTRDLTVVF